MGDSVLMSWMITGILLAAGLVALLQAVNAVLGKMAYASRNLKLIDVIVVILYLLLCAGVGLLYVYSGYDLTVIYVTLGAAACIVLILFFRFCYRNREDFDRRFVILFVIYFAAVLYLALFMRIGMSYLDTSVATTPLDDFTQAVRSGNPALVRHMLQNIVFFVPFGILIPCMSRRHLCRWSFAMLGGLFCSSLIEGIQLVAHLGQSDIDDIIANTLGAVLGYLLVRIFLLISDRND